MLRGIQKIQNRFTDIKLKKVAAQSLREVNDIIATKDYLLTEYKRGVMSYYDPLLAQAVDEEVEWFIYPIFEECWSKHSDDPNKIVEIFQRSTHTLSLFGKNTHYNQRKQNDTQVFLKGETIESSIEFKQLIVGKLGGCPLMRVKSAVGGNLLTDFMITCVKFWIMRRQAQK